MESLFLAAVGVLAIWVICMIGETNAMQKFGTILVSIAAFGLVFAIVMDTAVVVPGESIGELIIAQRGHSIGLMDTRHSWLITSGFLLVSGVVWVSFGSLRSTSSRK